LDGALELFLARGLAAVTLDVLCQSLAIHRSSFYHHFKSKEAMAVELYQESIDELNGEIAGQLAASQGVQAGIVAIVTSYLQWFQRNPQRGAFVWKVMDSELMAEHIQPVRAQQRAFIQGLIEWLAPYQATAQVRRLSPAMLAALVIGPARDFVRTRPAGGDFAEALSVLPEAAWQSLRVL
jgi:AcrR family transcriptional regulator